MNVSSRKTARHITNSTAIISISCKLKSEIPKRLIFSKLMKLKFLKHRSPISIPVFMTMNSAIRRGLNGREILNRSIIDTAVRIHTLRVEYSTSDKENIRIHITDIIILSTIVNPAGMAFFRILKRNIPFILSLFGSSASIRDGIPIVNALISVYCIGINGYGAVIKINSRARSMENIVLEINNVAER